MFCSAVLDYNESRTKDSWEYINITRPYSMVYYVVDGTGFYKINNQEFRFQKNHLYIFPSETVISLYRNKQDFLVLTYIHAFISPKITKMMVFDVSSDSFIADNVKIIRKYIKRKDTIYTRKLIETLISYISEITEECNESLSYQIKKYIDDNYVDVFHKNNISEVLHFSNSYISDVFKKEYNITPKKYAQKLIIKHVMNLLQMGYSVNKIALSLNFSSAENFSRFFKNNYGCSPITFVKHFNKFQ